MLFSQRIGMEPIKVDLQREQVDSDLKISLWNGFTMLFIETTTVEMVKYSQFYILYRRIWIHYFKRPLDTMPGYIYDYHAYIRNWYFSEIPWYKILDWIEFIAKNEEVLGKEFEVLCNSILTNEHSAYRFIDSEIVEITDSNEVIAIESALEATRGKFDGVYIHLKSALEKLSDRKNPDYRNSIKESISAVEAISKIITSEPKAELGKALKKITDQLNLHNALIKSFSSLYGYTSDEGGIRHAMLDDSTIYYEDAKYMLVSCSAFTNYLIVKAKRANIFS